ncbi:hypothetical protein [Planctomicrobium piriforme]|uniref:DUF4175 family protein n=1 Tax=Planctomicrobium piriforme TaxID=1576369 RepID=A0A1I3R6S6_9PLAN|nr:hypothetical protein [Planctomicrobium piriforme]SFJ41472.1 hypothetical protein SAMN05421753_1208 [Planctomicrobium piriforme]
MPDIKSGLLEIPESLRRQLLAFRRRLRSIKLTEAVAGTISLVLAAYLFVFAVDRLADTAPAVRWAAWGVALLACGLIPLAWELWVRRCQRLDEVARLLSRRHPSVGDQLLGIIELAHSSSEQARSRTLVQAAIQQVSEAAAQRDFNDAIPRPRHRQKMLAALALAGAVCLLLVFTGAAARNAWARFLAPWQATPRYTFAAVDALPDEMIVPHGEPVAITVKLTATSEWRPAQGELWLPGSAPVVAVLNDDAYRFELPGQQSPAAAAVRIGDYSGQVTIKPLLRPELSNMHASVTLPEYLQRSELISKDLRGGSLTAVKGSEAVVTATVSRELASAAVNDESRVPEGAHFSTGAMSVNEPRELQLTWRDAFGLSAQQPFQLTLQSVEDEAPSVLCENLPRQQILLDSEVLNFQIKARDDFGVKRVGIEWQGLDRNLERPAHGERIIGAGDAQAELLDLAATFSAQQLGIAPQPVGVRVFVEDFLPGRERVYSPQCVFHVLDAEQHAIWVTAQLSRWHRLSLEVRDRELQLHETNRELRSLSAEELDTVETRRRLETQVAAERANGRRLSALVGSGEDLLKQAMRNPEIGVGHLDRWAEMMQILKDISGNRMPAVADLLKQATTENQLAQTTPQSPRPSAGQNRLGPSAGQAGQKSESKPSAPVPSIKDVESTMNAPQSKESAPPRDSKGSTPRLTLPNTMLSGNGSGKPNPAPSAAPKLDEAVREQQELLAEFEKIADELNTILANLEGSTLVKRLKASARKQQQVSKKLGSLTSASFGVPDKWKTAANDSITELASLEGTSSQEVSKIMDDMSAYFDRSRFQRFKVVLDDMRKQDVTGALRTLGDDLKKENGISISQADFWGDTLDRWAEDLVEVTKCGACPGCKSKGSLPPSIVLEVLQILEREVGLREETRVAEQARPAIEVDVHAKSGRQLAQTQSALGERIDKVIVRIRELPDAESDFGKELALLGQVTGVMTEATEILAKPDTGNPAIAAETEVIELLLKSKRFNPGGGGGGGDSPGGGGGGNTRDSALALVGSGVNQKEIREDRGAAQATGTSGAVLPEEYRSGLDRYFNRVEERQQKSSTR